jgi:hypothetical protein
MLASEYFAAWATGSSTRRLKARRPDHGLHNGLPMRLWFPQGDSIIAEIALVQSRVHGLPCE